MESWSWVIKVFLNLIRNLIKDLGPALSHTYISSDIFCSLLEGVKEILKLLED